MEKLQFFNGMDEIFNINGNSLFCAPNAQQKREMQKCKHDKCGQTVKHTHTFISAPSYYDLENVVWNDIEHFILECPKYRYQINKIGKKPYNVPNFKSIYSRIENEVRREYNRLLQSCKISKIKYKENFQHEVNKRLADALSIWTYSRRKL